MQCATSMDILCAIENGDTVALWQVIDSGLSLNFRDLSGKTPLHLAIERECPKEMLESLLSSGADPEAKDGRGQTPLQLALDVYADVEVVRLLLSARANPETEYMGMSPLMKAIDNRQIPIVEALLAAGANVNAKDERLRTPLHQAVDCFSYAITKILLSAGANPNTKDITGQTPLHLVMATIDCAWLVRILLSAGADPNLLDNEEETPLMKIQSRRYPPNVGCLLAAGADVKKFYVLHKTITATSNLNILRMVVEAGADINAVDKSGLTPLYYSVRKNDICTIRYLIEAGADPHYRMRGDITYLQVCKTFEALSIFLKNPPARIPAAKKFRRLDANFNDLSELTKSTIINEYLNWYGHGSNSLHHILRKCFTQRDGLAPITLLLYYGADPSAVDPEGKNAVYYAIYYRCELVAEFMMRVMFVIQGDDSLVNLKDMLTMESDTVIGTFKLVTKYALITSKDAKTQKERLELLLKIGELGRCHHQIISDYFKQCLQEIQSMKEWKVNCYCSMYDCVTKTSASLNKDIIKEMVSDYRIIDCFKIYADLIIFKLEYCFDRGVMLKSLQNLEISAGVSSNKKSVELSSDCFNQIYDQFNNKDLYFLITNVNKILKTPIALDYDPIPTQLFFGYGRNEDLDRLKERLG